MTTNNLVVKSLLRSVPVATRSQLLVDLQTRLLHDTESPESQRSCLEMICELAQQPEIEASYASEAQDAVVQYTIRVVHGDDNADKTFVTLGMICCQWPSFAGSLTAKLLDFLRARITYDSTRTSADATDHEEAANVKLQVALNSLQLLRSFIWQSKNGSTSSSSISAEPLLSCLFELLLVTTDRAITVAAKGLTLDLVRLHSPEQVPYWNKIKALAKKNHNSPTIVLELWLHILLERPALLLAESPFSDILYWSILQDQLVIGTTECKRLCLGILATSLELLDSDLENGRIAFDVNKKQETLAQYSKYITIYRAIVFDRYINQIKACLPDFTFLARPDSLVHPWWVVVLISAAIRKGTQESIRKIIGNWTLSFGHNPLVRMGEAAAQLLQHQLLPWAAQGQFFTSTTVGRNGTYTCSHGSRLMALIRDLVTEVPSPEHSLVFTSAVIQFLETSDNHIFAFARAYILEGLYVGSSTCRIRLTADDTMRLARIARRTGFQAIVNDYMLVLCAEILQRIGDVSLEGVLGPSSILVINESERVRSTGRQSISVQDHFHAFDEDFVKVTQDHSISRLERFCALLDSTQCKVLHHQGLEASCSLLLEVLDEDKPQPEARLLIKAFKAIWDEASVQEYPRKATLQYCQLILHRNSIRLAAADKVMSEGLSVLLAELYPMMQNKFYIFVQVAIGINAAMEHAHESLLGSFYSFLQVYAQSGASTHIEFALEAAMAPKLEKLAPRLTFASYYGLPDAFGHASVLDILLRKHTDSNLVVNSKTLLKAILKPWLLQREPIPVFSKWKSTVQLQIVLLLYEQLWDYFDGNEKQTQFDSLLWLLSIELLPRFRFLMEWILARMCVKGIDRRRWLLNEQGNYDTANPKLTVSIMKICQMVACLEDSTEDFALDLAAQLAVLASSAKVAMRHEAQWNIPRLWDEAQDRGWTRLQNEKVFRLLNEHIRTLDVYHDPPAGRLLNYFDPVKDHNLSMLLEGDFYDLDPQERPTIRQADMATLWDSKRSTPANEALLMPLGPPRTDAPTVARKKATDNKREQDDLVAPAIPLQTKATTLKDLAPVQQSLVDLPTKPRPRDVIVIASLIDTNYNVGGISRVSEIFGCSSLYVRKPEVIKSKDFTSVAVSSELWLPVKELDTKPGMIEDFLIERKLEGYTVVGIEQTDSSLILGREGTNLPSKLVLVIGGEREGIPANLLAQMDICVEIEQVGITRSMNVQTAVAVVLYEYARQHPMS